MRAVLLVLVLVSAGLFLPAAGLAESVYGTRRLIADAEAGDIEAQYTLAHLYANGRSGLGPDAQAAVRWFERAAAGGQRDAAFDLARFYLEGEQVPKNTRKALIWLTRAAETGHPEAQYWLGRAYRSSDPKRAAEWLREAARQGIVEAGSEREELCTADPAACR